MINIILSDVVGDRLDSIASGIAVPDDTTYAQAVGIVDKYRIRSVLPASVVSVLESGKAGKNPDTPKQGDHVFDRVLNILLGNNLAACRAARDHGAYLGDRSFLLTSMLTGEAREAARFFAAVARDIRRCTSDFAKPALVVSGGETTVTVKGAGKGGRNQEMALSFLNDFQEAQDDMEGIHFLPPAPTAPTAPPTRRRSRRPRAAAQGQELRTEYGRISGKERLVSFLPEGGGLFVTGPTNTNVCDIHAVDRDVTEVIQEMIPQKTG
jgi:hydroxypyruvate reductase